MRDLNSVTLIGRLTTDPQIFLDENKISYCRFTLAVNEDKDNADFINILTKDKVASTCLSYLKKGSRVLAEGRLQAKKSSYSVKAKRVLFL